jgi:hypothetical protein
VPDHRRGCGRVGAEMGWGWGLGWC